MSSAIVSLKTGEARQLDGKAQPDEVVREDQIRDVPTLARILTRILRDLAALKRRFVPRSITFRDVVSTGTSGTPYVARLTHRFGGLVEWSVVGVKVPGTVTLPFIAEATTSSSTTLVLNIYYPATLAIRVTESV